MECRIRESALQSNESGGEVSGMDEGEGRALVAEYLATLPARQGPLGHVGRGGPRGLLVGLQSPRVVAAIGTWGPGFSS